VVLKCRLNFWTRRVNFFCMKKILTADQFREADRTTMAQEPISSLALMERAAQKCTDWLVERYDRHRVFRIFCGPGNNGGDGLAIARLLLIAGYKVVAYGFGKESDWTTDRLTNTHSVKETVNGPYVSIETSTLPEFGKEDIIIDALFGTGMSRPLQGIYADIVRQLNSHKGEVIAIDLPSGLFADRLPIENELVVKATYTLTFQAPKQTFFYPTSGKFVGQWVVLDIRLNLAFIDALPGSEFVLEPMDVKRLFRSRSKFSHKGNYGHGLLIAGSEGKSGAALLAARSCLRSGVGLLTVHVPGGATALLQSGAPEAMVHADVMPDRISRLPEQLDRFAALGIGPGIGTYHETAVAVHQVLMSERPLVLDADALNILSEHKEWLRWINERTILTPHPKEFERLVGPAADDIDRHRLQIDFSVDHQVVVVLKGAHTCITTPEGNSFFNTTGNAGLAKGGSGDVLTGIILSFLAQGYPVTDAALLGVWFHGKAADNVARRTSMQGMLPSDVVEELPAVFADYERHLI